MGKSGTMFAVVLTDLGEALGEEAGDDRNEDAEVFDFLGVLVFVALLAEYASSGLAKARLALSASIHKAFHEIFHCNFCKFAFKCSTLFDSSIFF